MSGHHQAAHEGVLAVPELRPIESAITGLQNASLKYVSDYATIDDKQLTEAMLNHYVAFKMTELRSM